VALWRLIKEKKFLDSGRMNAELGFLYEGYKSNRFYWEFIIMLRKLAVVLISILVPERYPLLKVKRLIHTKIVNSNGILSRLCL
jgi:hypothetical protein